MAQEKRSEISAVVLTYNNENTIKACLESIRWTNQIIVVDSLSSDRTPEIAREYTDKIWQRPWPGYALQWNFAIDKAENDWILILASDEEVPVELRNEIEAVLAGAESVNGYFFPRKTYFLNKWIRHCGWYPDYSIRLIRRGTGRFDENKLVHEAVRIEGATGRLQNPILHYSYSMMFEYIDRMNKYTSLAAQDMLKEGAPIDNSRIKTIVVRKALKTFWKMYVRGAGFKDGMRGFFLSFFSAVYQLMSYAKYWEAICNSKETRVQK